MLRENANDLLAFIAVARERSFTKAAAQFGVSQSSLSHAIKAFETRLGMRLLTRTTRSVSLTEAGETLYKSMSPHFDAMEAHFQTLLGLRDKPAGTIRITAADFSFHTVLWPVLADFLGQYPDIKVEVICEYGLVDIVSERYDAGVRYGEMVADGMIAVRIAPDMRMAVVGSPLYFEHHQSPVSPRELVDHNCINMRFPTHGGLYAWEFEKGGQTQKVSVSGQLTVNGVYQTRDACLTGVGLGYLPETLVERSLADGRLIRVLEDWCPEFPGFHLYYPSRLQASPAFTLLVDALRYPRDQTKVANQALERKRH
ncbi:LysR family transcriptional regulator [Pseudomonas gingeri]|uniref:LysR family transcriptional regulator n=1 Tax=Pseudomonas gingeri TaxID=117681 RepID=UPI0015A0C3F7|nr:LysR family transcriptional regulator [Pseudomonas gingeri]NWD68894.1 LysR family transcriptional regulator [Pseudomonas gingeri]